MGVGNDEAEFRSFVERDGVTLLHAARLLAGDHHRGEDLLQQALSSLYWRWGRVSEPAAYVRRALVNAHIDQTRRRWFGERPTATIPDVAAGEQFDSSDERDELRRLLRELSAVERSVVVLRYYCDLSERDTAEALRLPVGTVKSTCARALARLRVEMAEASS